MDASVPRPAIAGIAGEQFQNIGSVSFLNAKPLIYGLESSPRISLHLDVPARLLEGLQQNRFDVALLPVIDYQKLTGAKVLTAGGIGCDGPTLTVRIFSSVPFDQIRVLACDTDSHTSIALARVILAEQYLIRPEFGDLSDATVARRSDAVLLIGDKVICEAPVGLPYQLDLGQAWKQLTGLPFVFAIWTARPGALIPGMSALLEQARIAGLSHVEEILDQYATPRGWPRDIARQYLTQYLKFEIGPKQLEAMHLFHELAMRNGAIPGPLRPLELY